MKTQQIPHTCKYNRLLNDSLQSTHTDTTATNHPHYPEDISINAFVNGKNRATPDP